MAQESTDGTHSEIYCMDGSISSSSDGILSHSRPHRAAKDEANKLIEANMGDSRSTNASKHLRMLRFANPGRFMEDFDPERSAREMRKMNRRIYTGGMRKNQMYDDSGRLLENMGDICDCLEVGCPGCHFPCIKCGSEMCGAECRCNRRWVYQEVEVEGANLKFHFQNAAEAAGEVAQMQADQTSSTSYSPASSTPGTPGTSAPTTPASSAPVTPIRPDK